MARCASTLEAQFALSTAPKAPKRVFLRMPFVEENKAIVAAAKSDMDALPLPVKQLREAMPIQIGVHASSDI